MKQIKDEVLTGERAAYASKDTEFINCIFEDGESPIKESTNIKVINCDFKWKYPLWYCKNVEVIGSTWHLMGRSGIWYTDGITIKDSLIDSPKQFRRSKNIVIKEKSDTGIIYEYKDVRIDEIASLAAKYCNTHGKRAVLLSTALHRSRKMRAAFSCEVLQ